MTNEVEVTEDTQALANLQAAFAEQKELVELLERRYNQEHQRGLQLELAGQKAEKQVAFLQEQLRSYMKENDNG